MNVENLTVDIPLATGVLHAVDDVSLHVDRGETLCIVGRSGCGKSLTSLAIMDLLPKKASVGSMHWTLVGRVFLNILNAKCQMCVATKWE